MSADALKSLSITNADATAPGPTANNTGQGAKAYSMTINDSVTPTTGGLVSTSSKYKMVRLPCNCRLKHIVLNADANLDSSTGLVLDVGAYYSDSTVDGTQVANQGTVISATAFASQLTFQATFRGVSADTAWTAAKMNKELWDALGLTSNPGGYIDVVIAVHTAATTAASNPLDCRVEFTVP